MTEHFDVLIVGAGLSGIGAAYHLQTLCPNKSYAILEGRDAIGGTWDLFRYPGVRSDSDMYTLGYRFRPWTEAQAIADGPATGARGPAGPGAAPGGPAGAPGPEGETVTLTCGFLLLCSGYCNYDRG